MKKVSVERLKELLNYDPDTGIFTWVIKIGSKSARSIAGTPVKGGRYISIMIDRTGYRAHRLAWLYMTGEWPENSIDHINGDGLDNSFRNLRDVDNFVNLQNQTRPHSRNKTGYLGVSQQGDKFRPRLRVDGRNISFGMFDTPKLAYEAYLEKKRELHSGCMI